MNESPDLSGTSVFVTGASGIVGSRLVARLLDMRARVIALVRDEDPRSELYRSGNTDRIVRVRGALDDLATLERAFTQYEVDWVFHLGAQTQVRHAQRLPLETLDSNVRGTYHLLEAVRRATRPIKSAVIASSDKAYGESSDLPYRETHPMAGRNVYDVSKSASDLIATAYGSSFDLPIGVARCANIYGPGDLNWDRIVPGTIRSLLAGERPIVRSDGTLKRDYIFVDDAVDAYLRLARYAPTSPGAAFNFGTGQPISVMEIVEAIGVAAERSDLSAVVLSDSPNEIPAQWLDSSKATSVLGWSATVPLASGLRTTVEWYRALLS